MKGVIPMFEKKTVLKVEGMSCGHCEKRVNDAVSGIAGIKSCKASAAKGQVTLTGTVDEPVLVAVKAAIADAGYKVVD